MLANTVRQIFCAGLVTRPDHYCTASSIAPRLSRALLHPQSTLNWTANTEQLPKPASNPVKRIRSAFGVAVYVP
jgi:hypothetical protein